MPDSQALNPRLSNILPDLRTRIHNPILSHYLKHITNTGNSNTTQEREYWECQKLLVP